MFFYGEWITNCFFIVCSNVDILTKIFTKYFLFANINLEKVTMLVLFLFVIHSLMY